MRGKMLVLGLTFGTLAAGCYYHRPYYRYGYGQYGYYQSPTYSAYTYPTAQPVQQQPVPVEGTAQQTQPPPQGVQVTATATVKGEGIAGSDGTRGWRVVVQSPEQEFQRLAQVAARANCQIESSTAQELRAVCNNTVHVVIRYDQQHIYKLCAPNTDPSVCAQVWSSVAP